jgi:hypothetical protein
MKMIRPKKLAKAASVFVFNILPLVSFLIFNETHCRQEKTKIVAGKWGYKPGIW